MEFLIYAERCGARVSAWDVASSGLFDSIGLYSAVTALQVERVMHWVHRLGASGALSHTAYA